MSSLIKLTRTIHFLEQFIIYNACMYLCIYTNIIWLCMIKARIRWCTCRVENILTLGKLLSLWFCFLLHSILLFISQTSYRTYKIISSYDTNKYNWRSLAHLCWKEHIPSIYLFYTSYSYNSISRYAYRGISAHIPRRDLVIFCVLRSHWLPLIRARMAASCETTGEYEV